MKSSSSTDSSSGTDAAKYIKAYTGNFTKKIIQFLIKTKEKSINFTKKKIFMQVLDRKQDCNCPMRLRPQVLMKKFLPFGERDNLLEVFLLFFILTLFFFRQINCKLKKITGDVVVKLVNQEPKMNAEFKSEPSMPKMNAAERVANKILVGPIHKVQKIGK